MGDIQRMELTGGHPGIDFVNTLGGMPERPDDEYLFDFGDVLTWLQRVNLGDTGDIRELARSAAATPATAAAVLGEIHQVRAATDRILRSRLAGEPPAPQDTEVLRDAWAQAVGSGSLIECRGTYVWTWDFAGSHCAGHSGRSPAPSSACSPKAPSTSSDSAHAAAGSSSTPARTTAADGAA